MDKCPKCGEDLRRNAYDPSSSVVPANEWLCGSIEIWVDGKCVGVAQSNECLLNQLTALQAKYERAITELENCARDYEHMNRAIRQINGHDCPSDGIKKAHNLPPRFHEFTQGPEAIAAILAEQETQ